MMKKFYGAVLLCLLFGSLPLTASEVTVEEDGEEVHFIPSGSSRDAARPAKLKFTYKEQKEFETIDDDIAALEEKIEENQAAQAAAGSDYVKLQQLQEELEDLQTQLEHKEERWMYLTELKEKIDAQK